jgi:hypothetical protein
MGFSGGGGSSSSFANKAFITSFASAGFDR